MPSMMRSFSSCFDATRMWRRTERANLEKKPSIRLSQEPCFGGEGEREAARRLSSEPGLGFSGDMRRVVVQDHLDRRAGRVSGIEKLEEFDDIAAAVAALDQGVDLAG